MIDFEVILPADSFIGKLARLPLRFIPKNLEVKILSGPNRGLNWVVGSSTNGCWLGTYESEQTKRINLLLASLDDGFVFYDCGANVGYFTLLASRLKYKKIYCFEPNPANIFFLNQHLSQNIISSVEVFDLALSKERGTASFNFEKGRAEGRIAAEGAFEVSLASLDQLVGEGKILPPAAIKMDIEGSELDALIGASYTLKTFMPLIFLSTHSEQLKSDCVSFLKDFGYRFEFIGNDVIFALKPN